MQFNLSQLLKNPSVATQTHMIDEGVIVNHGCYNLNGEVKFIKTNESIWIKACLETVIECQCSRCLGMFDHLLAINIDEEINIGGLTGEAEYEQLRISEDMVLDISETVRQYCDISRPMNPVCGNSCKGICPKCGTNLNQLTCDCDRLTVSSQWRGLVELSNIIEKKKLRK